MTVVPVEQLSERLVQCVDRRRLVETACAYVSTPSPTGSARDGASLGTERPVKTAAAYGPTVAGRCAPRPRGAGG